jgi:acetyltransferase-like isoleucine patch superfamily enzyme
MRHSFKNKSPTELMEMVEKRFKKWEHPTFDKYGNTKWNWMCQHHKNLKLGNQVDIGAFTYINAKNGVHIEDYVQIGSHCSLYSLSTIDNKQGKIILKWNCRIGTHSVVMPNVTIGKNTIIGAFSFVNTDIPDNTIAYGVPATIKRRLTKKEIENLEEAVK